MNNDYSIRNHKPLGVNDNTGDMMAQQQNSLRDKLMEEVWNCKNGGNVVQRPDVNGGRLTLNCLPNLTLFEGPRKN